MLEYAVFLLLGVFALLGGGMILLGRRPATLAMGVLIALLALSGLFALLHQSFLFFAQLLVAVGGVVVVTLIAIMTVNLQPDHLPNEPIAWGRVIGAVLLLAPFGGLLYRVLCAGAGQFPAVPEHFGTAPALGKVLFGDWVLPFEVLSILLLAAMVGAIVIGNKEPSHDHRS